MPCSNLFWVEKLGLLICGLSVTKKPHFLYQIYSIVAIAFFTLLYAAVLLMDLLKKDFNDSLDSWMTFIGYLMVLANILITMRNRGRIGTLLVELQMKQFTSLQEALIEKWRKFKDAQTLVLVAGILISIATQIIYSLTLRFTKANPDEWKLGYGSIYVINITYSPNFEIIYAYQSLSIVYCTVFAVTITMIIMGVLQFLATQFKILQMILRDDEEKIGPFVQHHVRVTRMVRQFEQIFGSTIFCIFLGVLGMNCIDIYRASLLPPNDLGTVRIFSETITSSIQIFLICNAAEEVARESELLAKAAYDVDFVGADLRFQKCFVIILGKAQSPCRIKAGKLIDVSLISFAGILRATYSAYAMLKSRKT